MVCGECRKAGNQAAVIITLTEQAPNNVPMGSLHVVMRGHEKCKGGTWCDCKHQMPSEGRSRG